MIVRLEENSLTDALILLVYDTKKRCRKMTKIAAGTSEESLLFYAWFYVAQNLPGPVRENGLLNMSNRMMDALSEGGEHEGPTAT